MNSQIEKQQQNPLDRVTDKHLVDPISDQLYQPFRDISHQLLIQKYKTRYNEKDDFFEKLQNTKIPHNLKALQISKNKVSSHQRMVKIGQRQKVFDPISKQVLSKLLETGKKTQIITYRYANLKQQQKNSSDKNKTKRLRCVTLQKTVSNMSNFRERLQKSQRIKTKDTKYNIFSIFDRPVNSLIKGSLFTCGDCTNNQLIAKNSELVWQLDQ